MRNTYVYLLHMESRYETYFTTSSADTTTQCFSTRSEAMQMQPIIETLHKAVFKTTFACRFNRITYFLLHLENSYEIYFATVAADTIMHRFRHAVKLYKGNQSLNRRTKSSSKQYFLIGSV